MNVNNTTKNESIYFVTKTNNQITVLPDGRMKIKDAAKYLGVAPITLYKKILDIPRIKIGGTIFYFKDDLDNYVQTREKK